jgi:hypothetical protein
VFVVDEVPSDRGRRAEVPGGVEGGRSRSEYISDSSEYLKDEEPHYERNKMVLTTSLVPFTLPTADHIAK